MDLHKLLDNASSPTAYIRPDQQHPRQSPWSSTVEANMLPSFSTLAKSVDHATNDDIYIQEIDPFKQHHVTVTPPTCPSVTIVNQIIHMPASARK
ncbi:hypothetical protein N7471_013802 [Penicillium samsonianum]|uniref:uncharacterized protein n=1 Tax=Penicillium samsonianum TaxID=1882272 RepID=UPI002547A8A0|nr:uncharacterized protein N7471_013802 [Penicillium samsonianum]KAJ6118335.1 hypothetical protein N7471_013802 [Penicillium samsonianum]